MSHIPADAPDKAWADLARSTRSALSNLGYTVGMCLPDESARCGGTYAEHAMANLAAIKACADHHLSHLHADSAKVTQIYTSTLIAVADHQCTGAWEREAWES